MEHVLHCGIIGGGGVIASSHLSAISKTPDQLVLVGDQALLEIGETQVRVHHFSTPLSEYRASSPDWFGQPAAATEIVECGSGGTHLDVYQDLVAALQEQRAPQCDAQGARASLELANAITLSHFLGKAVELPLDGAAYHVLLEDLRSGRRSLGGER